MYLFFIANDCNCFLPSLESGNRVKVIPQGQFILPSCFFLLRKTTEQNASLSWTGIAAYAVEGCYVSCIITGYGGRPLSFLLIAEHFGTASIPLVLAWNWSIIWQTGLSERCHPTLSALSFAYFNISFYFICICNCEETPGSFPPPLQLLAMAAQLCCDAAQYRRSGQQRAAKPPRRCIIKKVALLIEF